MPGRLDSGVENQLLENIGRAPRLRFGSKQSVGPLAMLYFLSGLPIASSLSTIAQRPGAMGAAGLLRRPAGLQKKFNISKDPKGLLKRAGGLKCGHLAHLKIAIPGQRRPPLAPASWTRHCTPAFHPHVVRSYEADVKIEDEVCEEHAACRG